jgi:YhcN/YlaJ family sporulation lipoprotein
MEHEALDMILKKLDKVRYRQMFSTKYAIKGLIVLLILISVISTGCTNNRNNQVRQQGMNTQQAQNQPQGNTDNRIQIAEQAADKIAQLNEVKQANVLVTNRNAYVAAALDANQQLTRDIEDRIAQQVKATDPNIQNVYVSTNPEFVDRIRTYVAEVRQGRPVAGFFEQFSEMVQRIFPNAR